MVPRQQAPVPLQLGMRWSVVRHSASAGAPSSSTKSPSSLSVGLSIPEQPLPSLALGDTAFQPGERQAAATTLLLLQLCQCTGQLSPRCFRARSPVEHVGSSCEHLHGSSCEHLHNRAERKRMSARAMARELRACKLSSAGCIICTRKQQPADSSGKHQPAASSPAAAGEGRGSTEHHGAAPCFFRSAERAGNSPGPGAGLFFLPVGF